MEHVHVNEGGQAIVGAVSATNGEGEISDAGAWTSCEAKRMAESIRQSARRFHYGAALWRENPARDTCPGPAMHNARCRMHGGPSTGPKTAEGMARSRQATKHGRYSNRAKAERAAYLMRQCREVLDSFVM